EEIISRYYSIPIVKQIYSSYNLYGRTDRTPIYEDEVDSTNNFDSIENRMEEDELYVQALEHVLSSQRAQISNLQINFGIGYNRAARIMHALEKQGIIGSQQGAKPREILFPNLESYLLNKDMSDVYIKKKLTELRTEIRELN